MRYLLFIFTLVVITNFSFANYEVPVLVWNSNKHAESIQALSALQSVDYSELSTDYLSKFGASGLPENIILFLQDQLSLEDLSSNGKELEFLRSQMENGHSLFLQKVKNGGKLPQDLQEAHGYNVINLEPESTMADITLKKDSSNLVIVNLPPTATNPSRSTALMDVAKRIRDVISSVGNLASFTMIYTGLKNYVTTGPLSNHERYGQGFAVSKADTGANISDFHTSMCALLYFRNEAVLTIKDATDTIRFNLTELDSTDEAICQSNEVTFSMNFDTISNFSIVFHFRKINGRHWLAYQATFVSNNESEAILKPPREMMWVPLRYSYSCSLRMVLKSNSSVTPHYRLDINGIQMQAFTANSTSFGKAWDCVGFFTIPIWSGLIVTFVMILILGWGMSMLADIKTMDRFDDPKGKYILVPPTGE